MRTRDQELREELSAVSNAAGEFGIEDVLRVALLGGSSAMFGDETIPLSLGFL